MSQTSFECVWEGCYLIVINKPAYDEIFITECFYEDTTFVLTMEETRYPVRILEVDFVTGLATWDPPMVTALDEDFNGASLPNGWQLSSPDAIWTLTMNGSGGGWSIPPWNSQYMCKNDAISGTTWSGTVDYLISPEVDLSGTDEYYLRLDSYFDGQGGQFAFIEYSYDAGASWDVLYSVAPHLGEWDHLIIDISGLSGTGTSPVFFGFNTQAGTVSSSGWAVDNVQITGDTLNPVDYNVFLNSAFLATTDTNFYQFYDLIYGQNYTACVSANYLCGTSEQLCIDFTSAYLRPPEWIAGDTIGQDVMLHWLMDTTEIANNILAYHVYRDSIQIAYIPFTGEDTSYYTDASPDPMCYNYHVSTLYDLSNYGFPGDTGESLYTGPEEVCLAYGTYLPYFQDWTNGNPGNFWTFEDNWVINGQYGNLEPSAEFTWNPMLNNYSSTLISGAFNGVFPESKSGPYVSGSFILTYDVKLDNMNQTGDEHFSCDIWVDGIWHPVASYDNGDGSFDWITEELDISEIAFGKTFKIRFVASGALSSDILSWFVDNISIERVCYPPQDLMVEGYSAGQSILYWRTPDFDGADEEWIMWDDGMNNGDGIGLAGGGVFSIASHWDADMITQYDGQYITKIRFFPYDNAITTVFTLKVWRGPDAGTLVYEEPLSGLLIGAWNEIILATPVMIDASQELWIGYSCDQPDGENPAGFDAGPAVVGYGDMITLDGITWDPISTFGFDLNWNLQALISDSNNIASNDTLTYHIYFKDIGASYELIGTTTDTSYIHSFAFQYSEIYYYYVLAVYEDCEANSNEVAYWLWGISDDVGTESISVFPNPTNKIINVESAYTMSELCLLDLSGRMLECHELSNKTQYSMDVSSYEPGVYLLRIDTEQGRLVRKIIVNE